MLDAACFVPQSYRTMNPGAWVWAALTPQIQNTVMKTLARIGAGLSFAFFFLGGMTILAKTHLRIDGETIVLTALGLFLVGTAFFVGPMLWLAAEKHCSREDGK